MICTVYRNLCFYTSVNMRNWIKYNAVYLKTIDMLNVSAPSRTPIFRGNRKDPGGLPMITNGVKQDKETGLTVWNEHYPFGKTLDNLTSFFYNTLFIYQNVHVHDNWNMTEWKNHWATEISAIGDIYSDHILQKLFLWHNKQFTEKYCLGSWVIFCAIPINILGNYHVSNYSLVCTNLWISYIWSWKLTVYDKFCYW